MAARGSLGDPPNLTSKNNIAAQRGLGRQGDEVNVLVTASMGEMEDTLHEYGLAALVAGYP